MSLAPDTMKILNKNKTNPKSTGELTVCTALLL